MISRYEKQGRTGGLLFTQKSDLEKSKMSQFDPLFKDYMVRVQDGGTGLIPDGVGIRAAVSL